MPRVPEYQSNVSRETPMLNTPSFRTPAVKTKPQAAFGGAEASANAMLGEAVSRAGQALSGIAVQKMKMNAEKEALKLSTEFQVKLDEMLYSPEKETVMGEDGKPVTQAVGILNWKLGQTKDAGKKFDGSFAGLMKDFEGRPGSGYEQAIFNRMAQGHYVAARNGVFRHQAREERAEYAAVMEAGINQGKQSVTQCVNVPDLLDAIERVQGINETGMRNLGTANQDVIDDKNADLAGEMTQISVMSMLDREPMRAQAIFEAVKDEIPGSYRAAIEDAIRGKLFADQRVKLWESASGQYRRADGSYDKEAMRAGIMGLPGYNTTEKENLINYAEARANDSEAAFRKNNAANDRQFMNDIITMKNQGTPLDDQLKLASSHGRDAADVRSKENLVKKLQDSTVTNPEVEWELYKGIREGTVSKEQLDSHTDSLSGNDYMRLRKDLNKSHENPQTHAAFKNTWKQIEEEAKAKYSNKRTQTEFLLDMKKSFAETGGTPEQLLTLASDKMKRQKTKWYQILPGSRPPAWEIDAEKDKAMSLLKGKLENAVGRDIVSDIAEGIEVSTGKDAVSIADINEIVGQLGGIEAIGPGTPGYKAIQILRENDKLVTPDAVKFVISNYPEWK